MTSNPFRPKLRHTTIVQLDEGLEVAVSLRAENEQHLGATIDFEPTSVDPTSVVRARAQRGPRAESAARETRLLPRVTLTPAQAQALPQTIDPLPSRDARGEGRGEEGGESSEERLWTGEEPVALAEQLGEGGMGVVYRARQERLQREIAVKRLRAPSAQLRDELIREAVVMGRLSHPNIPPVYSIRLGAGEQVEVLMKQIEGVTLLKWLGDQPARGERLREALRIIAQVCYALEFAHSQGTLHRDVKAENVMLGRFHEVYLIDWGLALDLNDLEGARPGVVGTPTYMAPEMLSGDPRRLSVNTDVYLLGALLHHALTGKGRHEGDSIASCLRAALKSLPYSYPADVPADLAALCNDACHLDPARRPSSVEAFRERLERHLNSWEAFELVARARQLRATYERLIATRGDEEAQWEAAHRAKNTFEQALHIRPDLEGVNEERESLLWLMIQQALSRSELRAARALAHELSDAAAREGAERDVQLLLSQEEERRARLMAFEREHDPRPSVMPRALLARVLLGGALCAIIGGYTWLLLDGVDGAEIKPQHGFWIGLSGGLPTLLSLLALRRRLLVNELGRRATRLIAFIIISVVANRYLLWRLGAPLSAVMSSDVLLMGLACALSELVIPRASLLGALGLLTAFMMLFAPAGYGPILINIYVVCSALYIYFSWRSERDEGA